LKNRTTSLSMNCSGAAKCGTAPNGFTLLEVMVALMIMAVLSILTGQTLKSAIDNKSFVSKEISRDAQLADTLRIMRADIGAAFHYQNIDCKLRNDLNPSPPPASGIGQQALIQPVTAPGAAGTPHPCPPDVTGFIGSSDSIYFTSLSNTRTITDSQESDQAKIGYYLKSCHSKLTKSPGQCLYRSTSPLLDEDIDKPGAETLLLENVQDFKLRYLGPQHEDYVSEWKTGKNSSDEVSKLNFPYAVEITLTIFDKSNRLDHAATQMVLAPIYFENNPKKPGSGPSPTPGAQAQPAGAPAKAALPPSHP